MEAAGYVEIKEIGKTGACLLPGVGTYRLLLEYLECVL